MSACAGLYPINAVSSEANIELDKFFIVVPLGFETLAHAELAEKFPHSQNAVQEKGGFTVACSLREGFSLNYALKIPSAVLLRLAEFKCRDFPKLYQKTSNMKWGRYLIGGEYALSVSSSKSRLLNEKKIAEAVNDGIRRHFQKQPPKRAAQPYVFEILVRFLDDQCTFSLNTSGELLFKRGYKKMTGVAPIRENLAAGLFYALKQTGVDMSCLVDPMCGTGTLLFESALFYCNLSERDFAFEHRDDWLTLVKEKKETLQAEKALVFQNKLIGFDQSEKTLNVTQENGQTIKSYCASFQLDLQKKDVMKDDFQIPQGAVVMCNPPYNERLKITGNAADYYAKMIEKTLRASPQALGIIIPKKYSHLVPRQISHYKAVQELGFSNGGIQVVFKVYRSKARNV